MTPLSWRSVEYAIARRFRYDNRVAVPQKGKMTQSKHSRAVGNQEPLTLVGKTWMKANGERVDIRAMTDSYMVNTIGKLKRKISVAHDHATRSKYDQWLAIFETALRERRAARRS
jgi:hypothetical protein